MDVKQKYYQDTDGLSQLQLGTRCRIESQRQTVGYGPSVTHGWATPDKMRKKCCYGQKNLGSICGSLSPSPTHFSHTTNINPFENKVWEIYFYKEVCSSIHWSSSLCLIMFRIYLFYVYVCGYTTGAPSGSCSKQCLAFLCSFHLFFFPSKHFVSVQVVPRYGNINTVTPWKKSCFISSERSDFHTIDNLSMTIPYIMKIVI